MKIRNAIEFSIYMHLTPHDRNSSPPVISVNLLAKSKSSVLLLLSSSSSKIHVVPGTYFASSESFTPTGSFVPFAYSGPVPGIASAIMVVSPISSTRWSRFFAKMLPVPAFLKKECFRSADVAGLKVKFNTKSKIKIDERNLFVGSFCKQILTTSLKWRVNSYPVPSSYPASPFGIDRNGRAQGHLHHMFEVKAGLPAVSVIRPTEKT